MKKNLFTLAVSVCAFAAVAQAQKIEQKALTGVEMDRSAIELKAESKVALRANRPLRKMQAVDLKKTQFDPVKMREQLVEGVSVDILDADTLIVSSRSYFSLKPFMAKIAVSVSGDQITFTDLLLTGADYSITGTVNGSTVTVALGQTVLQPLSNGKNENASLGSLDAGGQNVVSSGNITGTIDEENGTITFDCYLGVVAQGGSFYELYEPGMVLYTSESCPLIAEYLPSTGFYVSASNQGTLYPLYLMMMPPSTFGFIPVVSADAENPAYGWTMDKLDEQLAVEETITSTEPLLALQSPVLNDIYTVPTLTVTEGQKTATYQAGNYGHIPLAEGDPTTFYQGRYMQIGGGSFQDERGAIFDLTNADLDYGFTVPMAGQGQYYYGTGSGIDDIIARYEDPGDPFDIYMVSLMVGAYSNPQNLPLTLNILDVQVQNNSYVFGDTLATASAYEFDSNTGTLWFGDFKVKDEAGFDSDVDAVRVDGGFAIALGGLNQEGLELAALAEEYQRPYTNANTLITVEQNGRKVLTQWIDYDSKIFFALRGNYVASAVTSVPSVESDGGANVLSTSDAFNFTYTDDFTSVDVYNVNGQKVSTYALPQTGTFSIAKAGLADGVYMFRMNGKTTEVLRAVK